MTPHIIPVRWNFFSNVHEQSDVCSISCVIHNQTDHHMRYWPLHWRGDRRIFERICQHGIGHPDPDQGPYWESVGEDWQWVHGCDGCCRERDEIS